MSSTNRPGQVMRTILVVLWATRGSNVSTGQLAAACGLDKAAVRHSLARLVKGDLVENRGDQKRAAWVITSKGLDVLQGLWSKEGGAAGR